MRKLIIYHAISFYQTLVCVVHSCIQEESEKVLLFTTSIKENVDTRELEKFFSKVIYINIREGFEDRSKYQELVINYFDSILEKNEIVIDENTMIYSGGSHYNFGTYLSIKQFPFYYIEEACGLLSDAEHVRNIDRNNRAEVDIIDELGLYDATSQYIVGIICNVNEQRDGYMNPKMIHFDTLQQMKELDVRTIQNIMKIFGTVEKLVVPQNCVVFLSQHYANLNMMSYERQALLYGLVFDYFLSDKNILIKKHPADFMAYEAIYPKVQVIKESFLSEFIPFIMSPIPRMVGTISSTGINALRSVFEESIEFDFDFEEVFESIHKIYFAVVFSLTIGKTKTVSYIGLNTKVLDNLCRYAIGNGFGVALKMIHSLSDIEAESVLLVDRMEEELFTGMSREEIAEYFVRKCPAKNIVFINSNKDYLFYSPKYKSFSENIVPIVIKKKNLGLNRDYEMYDDFTDETIYVLSKEERARQMAINFHHSKQLDNLKVELQVDGFETEEQMKISVLQGMLEATEQRLLYYMKICKEQEELLKIRK